MNVRLGDGSLRKGQVLEIAGKRAVVQVNNQIGSRFYRSSKELQALIISILMSSSQAMSSGCLSVLKCLADLSTDLVLQLITVPQFSLKNS